MIKLITFAEFVKEAIAGRATYSRHMAEIDIDYLPSAPIGDRIRDALHVLRVARGEFQEAGVVPNSLAVFLALEDTDSIRHWDESVLLESGVSEPDSIYSSFSDNLLGDEFEEYRYPISIDDADAAKVSCLFRSFRGREYIANDWEYSNGIFLIMRFT